MTNVFVSVLDKIGLFGKEVWKVANPIIIEGDKIGKDIEPGVATFFPQFSPLFNLTVTLIGNAEASAAAAGAQKAGKQKLALVLASLLPYALQEAQALGIVAPTETQMTTWVNAIVAALNAFGTV